MTNTTLPALLVSDPAPLNLQDTDIVWVCQGGVDVAMTGLQIKTGVLAGRPVDIYGEMQGTPDYDKRWNYVFTRGCTLPASLTGSRAGVQYQPTGTVSYKIYKNATQIGTMNFTAGSVAVTFTFASAVTFAAGDLLRVEALATPDATLKGLYFTFVGALT